MYLTQENYKDIEKWLSLRWKALSKLPLTDATTDGDLIALLQKGTWKFITAENLATNIIHLVDISSAELVQTTGDDSTAVMSQKAVTDALDSLEAELTALIEELENSLTTLIEETSSTLTSEYETLKETLEDSIGELEDYTKTTIVDMETAYSERFDTIEAALFPITVSLTASDTLLEYDGSSQEVTLSFTVTRFDEEYESDVTITLEDETLYSDTVSSGTLTTTLSTYGNHTFTLTATNGSLTTTTTVTVRLELPMYFGFSPYDTVDYSISYLTEQTLATSPKGTYTLENSTTGYYLWLCVPEEMEINEVTSSGFEVPMEDYTTLSLTLGDYKCYRSSAQINSGTMIITIS